MTPAGRQPRDFLRSLGPVAMARSCRAWQGGNPNKKEVGACACHREQGLGVPRPGRPVLPGTFGLLETSDPARCSLWTVDSEPSEDISPTTFPGDQAPRPGGGRSAPAVMGQSPAAFLWEPHSRR